MTISRLDNFLLFPCVCTTGSLFFPSSHIRPKPSNIPCLCPSISSDRPVRVCRIRDRKRDPDFRILGRAWTSKILELFRVRSKGSSRSIRRQRPRNERQARSFIIGYRNESNAKRNTVRRQTPMKRSKVKHYSIFRLRRTNSAALNDNYIS